MALLIGQEGRRLAEQELDDRIRERLRSLRVERGLTLQDVADAAAMDPSTLSRLESGRRRLAVDHLPGLAAALDVTVDELLRPTTPTDPRVRRAPQRFDQLTVWPLTHRGPAGVLRAYRIRIDAQRDTPPDPLPVHTGRDWMYVVAGRMRLLLGTQDLVIEPGETVEFSTLVPHWFGAVDGPVELIAILSEDGEHAHALG